MALGATHWEVEEHVAHAATSVVERFGGSWNTYVGHGISPAAGEYLTVDYWGPQGRGDTLDEHTGDQIVAWVLGQHQIRPVLVLIWWSWWWRPGIGWMPYPGLYGPHGPGPDAHVHVGYA